MDIARFKELPILGILRGIELAALEPLLEAVMQAGLETIEITMNTQDAAQLITRAVKYSRGRFAIGAGTVLTKEELKCALDSGATFIVMPTLIRDLTEYCVKNKIPVFPGALTPQEIYHCWQAGATMVKVFPAKFFGPEYFRELKAPFGDIELLACGGITPQNLEGYFRNGASAVSIGSSVFRKEWLKERDFASISACISQYLLAFNKMQGSQICHTRARP
jgi:2-dehydro-3-deoxyphosphogluconate aldolase/(4S)-4-hydroxy-2-oxoglutarate aldolase